MKAQAIGDLESAMALPEAARRIVAVRANELFGFVPAALDERNGAALHDMRIAAKRLRYVLELLGFVIGPVADEAQAQARELQTVIGEVHDYDVLIARLDALSAKGPRRGRAPPGPAAAQPARRPLRRVPRAVGPDRGQRLARTLACGNHPFTERLDPGP